MLSLHVELRGDWKNAQKINSATSMMCVETMFASAAEGPSVAEWEALENVFYIVTLL